MNDPILITLSLNNLGCRGTLIVVRFMGGENGVKVGGFANQMNSNVVFSLEGRSLLSMFSRVRGDQ